MGKYCIVSATLPALLLSMTAAMGGEGKDLSYYCTTDVTGGLSYSDRTKKWEPTNFKPEGKFVLKMEFFRTYTKKEAFSDADITEYAVSLTAAGSKLPSLCTYDYFYAHTDNHAVPLTNGRLRCNANLVDYIFDFDSNRFLAAYLQGYTDGKDTNENTPSVSAGTCTKIN